MPSITELPIRSNAITYDEDTVQEVVDLLSEVVKGQGVIVDDEAQPTDGKARNRARIMADAIERSHEIKCRTHTVETDDGFYAVLSEKPAKSE